MSLNDLEQEFIFHYFTTVNRMKEIMQDAGIEMKIDTYFRLLKRVTDTITIPFRGEPLSGLQIMGVLETRALDFDRLIILSMNSCSRSLVRCVASSSSSPDDKACITLFSSCKTLIR